MALLNKPALFLNEVKTEMSKVSWPKFDELKASTWIVIIISIFFAAYVFVLDQALTQLMKLIY